MYRFNVFSDVVFANFFFFFFLRQQICSNIEQSDVERTMSFLREKFIYLKAIRRGFGT